MGWISAVLFISLTIQLSCTQDVQDIRLVNGTHGNFMGRVEVLYNGTWGAVCGDNWSYDNTKTTCRQYGFPWAVCYLPYSSQPLFEPIPNNQTIWMNNVDCGGSEDNLGQCSFNGYGVDQCNAGPAQVVCQSYSLVGSPTNVTQSAASSITVTVNWTIPSVPEETTHIRHMIFYQQQTLNGVRNQTESRRFFTRQRTYRPAQTRFSIVIHSLTKNATYTVRIRTQVRFYCRYGFLVGTASRPLIAATNPDDICGTADEVVLAKVATLPIRLVPPVPNVDFMGRVEVQYNNTWGTICDDNFGNLEADAICRSLNFTEALCYVREAGMGQGSGPIWMDNVDCAHGNELLEDCTTNGWGVHNCRHDADIGVICLGDNHVGPVEGVTAEVVGSTSIRISWNAFPFPPLTTNTRYRVLYSDALSDRNRVKLVNGTETTDVLTRLRFGQTYSVEMRPEYRYEYCTAYANGGYSQPVFATTNETAPSAPPTSFHVLPLSSTSIEFQWGLPLYNYRNGVIRGFKLFLKPLGQDEAVFSVDSRRVTEHIFEGLTPSTVYTCSILAYTVADGPRSVFLTVVTPDDGFVPFISGFGLYGDGLDRATVWPDQSDIQIHCDVSNSNLSVGWYYRNGTSIGFSDRNFRQVQYQNGTMALQIASARMLTYCDAGVYTCVVNNSLGQSQRRDFSLMVTDVPPRPSSPYPVRITSTSVTLAWDEPVCDGGHTVTGFTIRYRKTFQEYVTAVNMYVYNVDPSYRTYTVIGLETYTSYNFSTQAFSAEYKPSEFSLDNIVTTTTAAPSPPRSVTVRIASPYVIEASWREPAEPNGIVSNYTVYGTPVPVDLAYYSDIETPEDPGPFKMVVSGGTGSVNITVPTPSVEYIVEVGATVIVGGEEIEGERSEGTFIYIPDPDIPVVQNLRVSRTTNASIVLGWDYPSSSNEAISGFKVSYSSEVEWRSRGGVLLRFTESMYKTVNYNTATLSPLTPGTEYSIRVSVVTQRGEGEWVGIIANTGQPTGERLAYFQLMMGPIDSCRAWQANAAQKISSIRSSLLNHLSKILCPTCGLTNSSILNEELSCRGTSLDNNQVIYRGRMLGTDSYSATGLVQMIGAWVQSAQGSIVVDSARLDLEARCETVLDSPMAPDCTVTVPTTTATPTTDATPTTVSSITDNTPSIKPEAQSGNNLSGGAVGGLVLGLIIAVLLVIFIILLVAVLLRNCSCKDPFRPKPLIEEPLAEGELTQDNLAFESKDTSKGTDL